MFFNSKRGIILYLDDRSLGVLDEGGNSLLTIDFPPNIIFAQEVVDPLGLKKLLEKSFQEINLGNLRAVILLDGGILYTKILKTNDPDLNSKLENFFNKIPFSPEHLGKKVLNNNKDKVLIATNLNLVEIITETFQKRGCKVLATLPAPVFDINAKSDLSQKDLKIFKNLQELMFANFLNVKPQEQDEKSKVFSLKKILILLAIFLITLIFCFAVALYLGFIPK